MTAREPAHLAPRTRSVSKRIKQKRIIMHRVTARGEETAPPNPEGGVSTRGDTGPNMPRWPEVTCQGSGVRIPRPNP